MDHSDEVKWFRRRDPQSEIKHHLLSGYLRNWAIIVRQKHVFFCDCFAGAGAYDDDQPGSPLISGEILAGVQAQYPNCQFHIRNIEHNRDNYTKLVSRTDAISRIVDIRNYNGEYRQYLPNVIREIERHGERPALFFVDPFGYLDADPAPITSVMAAPHREVLVNLMSYALVRACGIDESRWLDGVKRTLGRVTINFGSGAVEDEIVNSYCKQFRDLGYFVCTVRVHSLNNPNIYFHMVHISRHWRALLEMKRQMCKNMEYQEKIKNSDGQIQTLLPFFEEFLVKMTEEEYERELLKTYTPIGSISFVDLINRELQYSPFNYSDITRSLSSLKKQGLVTSDGGCEDYSMQDKKQMAKLTFNAERSISVQTRLFDL